MIVNVVGVVEDGNNRARNVPANPRTTISMISQSDLTIRLTILAASGQPVVLTGGTVVLTVKKTSRGLAPYPATISRLGVLKTQDGPGRVDFTLVPADTDPLKMVAPGRYVYDIALTLSGARQVVVPLSPFIIEPAVGVPGAPTTGG